MIRQTLLFGTLITLLSCKPSEELATVNQVDLEKYAGTWYEVARFENSFEKGMKCVTATYTIKPNGKVDVLNQGVKDGKLKKSNGTAKVVGPGRLKVTFFWPFYGDYYIMYLDQDYQYALVGSPTRDYLWILSRTKSLPQQTYDELVRIAAESGFDTSRLQSTAQDCEK